MLAAASRVLADPDAPRSRQEAVEQVMAATQALAAGRGIQEAVALSGRRALARQKKRKAHPLKRKMRQRAGRSDDAAGGAAGVAAPGRAAALRERVKAKRRARRSLQ